MIVNPGKIPSFFKYLFLTFLLLISTTIHAQDSRALLLEPVVRVILNDSQTWSYSFGVAHRGLLLQIYDEEKKKGYNTEHLEFNAYSRYRLSRSSTMALRYRYRLNSWFNEKVTNEQRIIQEFLHAGPGAFLNLFHRVRFEQRFVNAHTIFRGRYRIGISKDLTEEFSIGASTEALYSVSRRLKPQPEQRFILSLTNTSFEDLGLSVGVEYRLDNYTGDAVRQTFIYTSATFYL